MPKSLPTSIPSAFLCEPLLFPHRQSCVQSLGDLVECPVSTFIRDWADRHSHNLRTARCESLILFLQCARQYRPRPSDECFGIYLDAPSKPCASPRRAALSARPILGVLHFRGNCFFFSLCLRAAATEVFSAWSTQYYWSVQDSRRGRTSELSPTESTFFSFSFMPPADRY